MPDPDNQRQRVWQSVGDDRRMTGVIFMITPVWIWRWGLGHTGREQGLETWPVS